MMVPIGVQFPYKSYQVLKGKYKFTAWSVVEMFQNVEDLQCFVPVL